MKSNDPIIDIDLDELREELRVVPSDIVFVGSIAAQAHGLWCEAKAERERIHSDLLLDVEFAEQLEHHLGKKPNADQLKAAILVEDEFAKAKAAEIAADVESRKAKAQYVGFLAKKGMLSELRSLVEHDGDRPHGTDGQEFDSYDPEEYAELEEYEDDEEVEQALKKKRSVRRRPSTKKKSSKKKSTAKK